MGKQIDVRREEIAAKQCIAIARCLLWMTRWTKDRRRNWNWMM